MAPGGGSDAQAKRCSMGVSDSMEARGPTKTLDAGEITLELIAPKPNHEQLVARLGKKGVLNTKLDEKIKQLIVPIVNDRQVIIGTAKTKPTQSLLLNLRLLLQYAKNRKAFKCCVIRNYE
jgi:hypothetical protein